ncbi:MAG: hypothetical protein LH618_00965, partial [Saprospiraceae bacterium]|nr:hypothetical protein [Saprospiraceae bacterium]
MKYLLILLTTFFLTHPLSAQMGMGKPKEIKALSERKMIVITETLSKKATDKLKKKGKTAELADIQQRYDAFNAMVKSVVAKRWTMHPEVEYKTWEQIKKMPNQKREQYAIMYFMTKRAASSSAGYIPAGYTMLTASMDEEETTKHNFSSLFQTFTIDKAEDVPVDKIKFNATPVYTITLPELYPSVLSVTFALASTNNYFEHRLSDQKYSRKTITKEIAANSARLKDKTLLIPDNWKDKE